MVLSRGLFICQTWILGLFHAPTFSGTRLSWSCYHQKYLRTWRFGQLAPCQCSSSSGTATDWLESLVVTLKMTYHVELVSAQKPVVVRVEFSKSKFNSIHLWRVQLQKQEIKCESHAISCSDLCKSNLQCLDNDHLGNFSGRHFEILLFFMNIFVYMVNNWATKVCIYNISGKSSPSGFFYFNIWRKVQLILLCNIVTTG